MNHTQANNPAVNAVSAIDFKVNTCLIVKERADGIKEIEGSVSLRSENWTFEVYAYYDEQTADFEIDMEAIEDALFEIVVSVSKEEAEGDREYCMLSGLRAAENKLQEIWLAVVQEMQKTLDTEAA